MKRYFIMILAAVALFFNAFAQSSDVDLYSRYEKTEGVSAIKLDRSMLKIAMLVGGKDLKPIKPLLKQTDTLSLMMFDKKTATAAGDRFWSDAQAASVAQCPLFTELSKDGDKARIFVKVSQDTVRRCIIITGGKDKAYMDLQGAYTLAEIQEMIK